MKNLLLVLSLVITASPAFASRARLESLGENKNGSYYINDGRNMFLNPAAINGYKKKLFLELGTPSDTADSIDTNAANNSRVQGGFTNTFGDFVYGLYVARESDRMGRLVTTANGLLGANTFIAPDHAFDFFFGGEASGLKYGLDLFHAGGLNQNDLSGTSKKTASLFGVKLGVDVNNFQVFTTVGIASELNDFTASDTTALKAKGKLSVDAGVTYAMDEMTLLGKFTTFGTDFTGGTASALASTTRTLSTMAFGLGAGWKKEASKSVTMYTRLQLDYQSNNDKTVTTGSTTETVEKWYNLPVVLGAEAAATSWLTVRGSISHSLIGQHQNGSLKDSLNNMTAVAMGLGFNFGDLTIDALAGQGTAVATTAGTESSMNGANTGSHFGFGDNMISRLSMTYNF